MAKTSRIHSLLKGQKHRITISSLAAGGEGISKELGPPIFVNRVAPGDVVEVELFDVRKDFARAKVVQLIEPSPQRAEPPCGLFKVCGGCQWMHLSYENQLLAKEDLVKQALTRIGGLDAEVVGTALGADEPLHYRNKVQFPVRNPKNSGRILAGYFQQDSHELVNIKHCPVQPELLDEILELVKTSCEGGGITAYDETTRLGALRHINMRYSTARDQVLVTVVLNSAARSFEGLKKEPYFYAVKRLAKDLMERFEQIVGVNANLNDAAGNKIMGDCTVLLLGEERLVESLKSERADMPEALKNGLDFALSATSFFQVNTKQTVKMLEHVYDLCGGDNRHRVIIDAYAGVGTFSLWLSALADEVIAIEEHPAAVVDGRANAAANGISNVVYEQGRVEDVLPKLAEAGLKVDIVVLDPPRKGVDIAALEAIRLLNPMRIIYVSCNPATLARDLKILGTKPSADAAVNDNSTLPGYKTKQVRPVDLFPQTYHVESVTVLERF